MASPIRKWQFCILATPYAETAITHVSTDSDGPEPISVCVVAPVFNEAEGVASFVETVTAVLDSIQSTDEGHRIVIVDDGSTDGTRERLRELADEDSRLRLVLLSRNFGHQPAVSAGMAHSSGDVVVVMDGDLQDDPAVIPALIERHRDGFDVVYAVRTNRKESPWLRAAYALHYKIANRVTRPRLPRDAGDFSLMSRRVVDEVNRLPERQRYVRGLRAWVGFRQTGVAVERMPRETGRTKYSIGRLINLAFDGLFSFSIAPIRIAMILGVVTILGGSAYAGYAVVVRLVSGAVPEGFTALIVATIFLNGIVLLFLGIVGEYVGRVYEEVKARPAYVVEAVIDADTNHG